MSKEKCKQAEEQRTREILYHISLTLARLEGKVDVIASQVKGGGRHA